MSRLFAVRPILLSLVLIALAVILWRSRTVSHPTTQPIASPSLAEGTSSGSLAPLYTPVPVEKKGESATPGTETEDRVAVARIRHGESIARRCAKTGLAYPPRELFLRAFKDEGELEVWGSNGESEMKQIATYSLTAKSGTAGPKRREGDRQIPEGCYHIVIFNPKSLFHLSMGLDYPNAADRVLSDPEKPGFDIYIHGSDRSVGCLALGDDMIEEVYLLAADVHARHETQIPVHIFPARMQGPGWDEYRLRHPEHADFWAELEPIYLTFENSHRVPAVKVSDTGKYAIGE